MSAQLAVIARELEAEPWSPSQDLAVSLVRAADLALQSCGDAGAANGVRKGLLAFEHLFKLRGAKLIEANLLVGQRIRTEWEIGRMLSGLMLRGGDRRSKSTGTTLIRLSDIGVTRDQSAIFQRVAQIDSNDLEHWISENLNSRELSTAALIEELWKEFSRARAAAAREGLETPEVDAAPCLIQQGSALALPLEDDCVALQVTSPPYGLDIEYVESPDDHDSWIPFMHLWLAEAYRVACDGGRLALNVPLDTTLGGFRPTFPQAVAAAEMAGWTYRFSIVWAEDNINKSVARGSVDSCAAPHVIAPVEMIGIFHKGEWKRTGEVPSDLNHDDWLEWTNGLWRFPGESNGWEGHPAPFPEQLPRQLIHLLSFPGETVLDQFCGSGTTILAAWKAKRVGLGFDIAEKYVASSRRRLQAAVQEAG